MNPIRPVDIMQRWNTVQQELLPDLIRQLDALTPKLEKVIHILEWVRIEEFVASTWTGVGRPPCERAWLANAFVAKTVLRLTTTKGLIECLSIDRSLRRICGFSLCKKVPSEATFSRPFQEFANCRLAERVHEALIKANLGDSLIGHLSRDATAIVAREHPTPKPREAKPPVEKAAKRKPGRPRKGEVRKPGKVSPLARQRGQTLPQMLAEISTACDRGSKCNAQGYKNGWNGYELHLDTADCGVPISALLSSASMHDSRAAIPLSRISKDRVTNLYDVMDAAYWSFELQEHCRSLDHGPLIDHNPRGGVKEEFEPVDAVRYKERSAAERTNARLKDEFVASNVMVKGHVKVKSHLMFGVLVLAVDQLMRLR